MANFNYNKVILGGRLTSDPELKHTLQGVAVTSFSVAVNRGYQSGGDTVTDFINCVAWRKTAEFITKYFKKGSSICVTGEINVRQWEDQNGAKRYSTDVVVSDAAFVDGKNDNAQSTPTSPAYSSLPDEAPKFEELGSDEDLPF